MDTLRAKPLVVSNEPDPVTGLAKVLPMSALTQKEDPPITSTKDLPFELQALKEKILSANETAEARQEMMYSLIKIGPSASQALVAIAKTNIPEFHNSKDPHSVGAFQERLELSLRITALEALDQMLMKKPDLSRSIGEIAHQQTNPILKFLAKVSLSGVQKNQPGKLKRTIDAMLVEVGY